MKKVLLSIYDWLVYRERDFCDFFTRKKIIVSVGDYMHDRGVYDCIHFIIASELLDIEAFVLKNDESFTGTITILFNDKEMGSGEISNKGITTLELGEYARKIKRSDNGTFYGDIDAFMLTNPDDLPKALKIVVNYCDSKNKCNKEEFKFSFVKHK